MRIQSGRAVFIIFILGAVPLAVPATRGADQPGFGGTSLLDHALEGRIYFLPDTTRKLPDFSTLKPVGAIYTRTLNVPNTDWRTGFPGITDRFEWFGIVYTGIIQAHQPGHYLLRVASDDGSKIYLDDKLVVNNDGLHPITTARGAMDLDTARHHLRIEYMQGPRYRVALQLYCTAPGGQEKLFPDCNLALDTPGCRLCWLWLLLIVLLSLVIEEIWRRRRRKPAPPIGPG